MASALRKDMSDWGAVSWFKLRTVAMKAENTIQVVARFLAKNEIV
jgi:hypothetical protein